MGSGPLDGIKVIEFGRIMAGPVWGIVLADLGADVVKIETLPLCGEHYRAAGGSIESCHRDEGHDDDHGEAD